VERSSGAAALQRSSRAAPGGGAVAWNWDSQLRPYLVRSQS
jgi:hypothetical protein